MRWLPAIALVLGLWALSATVLTKYQKMPCSGVEGRISKAKAERTEAFIDGTWTVAAAFMGLALLIELGKKMLTSKSVARSSGANASLGSELPAPPQPQSDGLSDDSRLHEAAQDRDLL